MHLILFSPSHNITHKAWLITALLLLLVPAVKCQKYGLSIEAGQQFGINGLKEQDMPFPSSTKFSMGNGVSRQLMFHLYPDSSAWYVSMGFNYLTGNNIITARRENLATMNYQVATRTMNSLRLISRVSYFYSIQAYSFSFSAGLILPVWSNTTEEYSVDDDSIGHSKTTFDIRNYTSLGFNGSIGISRQITPKIRFFLNSDINILNHRVKSRKVTAYENSGGKTMEMAYPDRASREIIYRRDVTEIMNNKDKSQQNFNKDRPTDKLAYRVTDSGIGLQVGFLFLF